MRLKKLIVLVPAAMAVAGLAAADGVGMMGYGMMSNGSYGFMGWSMLLWWVLGVGLVSFVFSTVFWLCYQWLVGGNKKSRKKK